MARMMSTRRSVLRAAGAALAGRSFQTGAQGARRHLRWVAFYGQNADERVLAGYDIIVLDPMFAGSVPEVAQAGGRVCGYLSLGEISSVNGFFGRLDPAALINQNMAWPGVHRIDVRNRGWHDLVLREMIPSITSKGFSGLMLDTLDTPPYLEQLDPKANRGMREAAVMLVRAIREAYPGLMVIMNRGYALFGELVGSIDAVVAESLLTSPDEGAPGRYRWNEASHVDLQLSLLRPACCGQTSVPILSLDYWDPEQSGIVQEIYARERQLGHHPYVAVPALDRIIPEPTP